MIGRHRWPASCTRRPRRTTWCSGSPTGPEPGSAAPVDDGREEEKAAEPVAVMPGSDADQDAHEAPSAQERSGSTHAVDADTRDEPSMEASGTVDAVDATDPAAADAD